MTKAECATSLALALTSASHWRAGLDNRYPDYRNSRAAKLLAKLAGEASNLSDECYESLRPFIGSPAWGEALKRAARLAGFHRRRMSLGYFVRQLVGLLSTPATA